MGWHRRFTNGIVFDFFDKLVRYHGGLCPSPVAVVKVAMLFQVSNGPANCISRGWLPVGIGQRPCVHNGSPVVSILPICLHHKETLFPVVPVASTRFLGRSGGRTW